MLRNFAQGAEKPAQEAAGYEFEAGPNDVVVQSALRTCWVTERRPSSDAVLAVIRDALWKAQCSSEVAYPDEPKPIGDISNSCEVHGLRCVNQIRILIRGLTAKDGAGSDSTNQPPDRSFVSRVGLKSTELYDKAISDLCLTPAVVARTLLYNVYILAWNDSVSASLLPACLPVRLLACYFSDPLFIFCE